MDAKPSSATEKIREIVGDATLGIMADINDSLDVATSIRFSIWDMAGQTVFYDLLCILLSRFEDFVFQFVCSLHPYSHIWNSSC